MSLQQPRNPQLLHIRVFLASPGDVTDERALVLKALEQLQYDAFLRGRITVETVAWDKPGGGTAMLATLTPQEAIKQGLPNPSQCDIVIAILWSRMGTSLPAEYAKPDGSRYLSGTEWEYLDAMQTAEQTGRPKVLVYRRTEKLSFDPEDSAFDEKVKQWRLVKTFFESFRNPDGSLGGGYNEYDTPDTFEKNLVQHLRDVIQGLLAEREPTVPETTAEPSAEPTEASEPPLWEGSPFPGLRAFGEDDAPIFFGRGRETDGLIRRLAEGNRFIAVVGASGSGKSSLVAAGLLPRLKANAIPGSKDWLRVRFTPGELGNNPFIALASGCKPLLEKHGRRVRDEAEKLRDDPGALEELARLMLEERPEWAALLLFVDQFEELFTVVGDEYRGAFIALLDRAARMTRLRTVVTLRADFYHRCLDQPTLAELLRSGSYPLAASGVGALYEMIDRPAARAGLTFEPELPERILDDTGAEPGALPLMAFALAELYEAGKTDGKLTHAAYDEFDGVRGAISKRAEDTFTALNTDAQATLDRVFRELVEVEKAEESWVATRRRAPLGEVARTPPAEKLVEKFTDARLLVQSRGEDDLPVVEVAHEALLRNWQRLVDWIDKTGDDLRLLRQLQRSAAEWKQQDRRSAFLWPRRRWRQARAMIDRLRPELDELEQRFLSACRMHSGLQLGLASVVGAAFALVLGAAAWLHLNGLSMRHGTAMLQSALGIYHVDEPQMIEISVGEFWMGSPDDDPEAYGNEKPRHQVAISKPFEIGKYEVTFDEYDPFAYATGRPLLADQAWGRGRRPVINVSWEDAMAYAEWLSEKTGKPYRLPTEVEWEYAARAGTESARFWGDDADQACQYANAADTRYRQYGYSGEIHDCDDGYVSTAEVGSFEPNAFGLHDMLGNVWEWTCSTYSGTYDGSEEHCLSNKHANNSASLVIRGGSWGNNPSRVRSAGRVRDSPESRDDDLGFRLARSLTL